MVARVNQIALLSVLGPAMLAAAIPTDGGDGGQCNNSGTAQCCQSVQTAGQVAAGPLGAIVALLGIALGPVEALVGLTCSPILGGGSCNEQAVCCDSSAAGGLINVGCVTIVL